MSSPPEGKLETKAGHPPAVKAGGMRIVQKHLHAGDTKEEKDKDDQEWESPRCVDATQLDDQGDLLWKDKDMPKVIPANSQKV
ncbi:death-associated protein 1 isoform X2 [Sciurus carolinensis]|uniref:death-associated protein 1 isoform X2 n=1 Tax=Sciurus carolinensis TaxID=30640 RepID=UPI001FB3F46F|nr:death-associated protein 1 isoform X2 [Sciurus carolinensis]